MGKYRFSYAQRYALWRAYDMKCFYCEKPLDFRNMTIDHVLPEHLHEEEGCKAGIPARPGLSAGDMKTKGVLTGRKPVLHLTGIEIFVAISDLGSNLCGLVWQDGTQSPLHDGGF
jgi:hypothetical protein